MATKKKAATEGAEAAVEEVTTEEAAAETAETTQAAATTEEKAYAYAAIKKDCRKLFGVPTIAFVAATSGLDTSAKYTISEIEEIINTWSAKEVK